MMEEFKKKNNQHRNNPKAGDFWNEMMCPLLLVVDVSELGVLVMEDTKQCGNGHWTWDFDKLKFYNKSEFRKKTKHETCYPNWMPEAVKEAIKKASK